MRRIGRALLVLGALSTCGIVTSCGSDDTGGDTTGDITGKWRIVEITDDGRRTYDHTMASVFVELQFDADGSALRITNRVTDGLVDTTAMTFLRTPTTMTVEAPAETVTYEYSLDEDGTGATFTNVGRVLHLKRLAE